MRCQRQLSGRALCLECRVTWVKVPPEAAHFYFGKVTALGVLRCFALFVCLTLLASFFLPSHLSLKHVSFINKHTFSLFHYRNQIRHVPLNLNRLQYFIDSGRLDSSRPINMYSLQQSGVVGRVEHGVKLLATVS